MQITRWDVSALLNELITNKTVGTEISKNWWIEKTVNRVLSLIGSDRAPKRKIDTPRSWLIKNDTVEKHQKRMLRLFYSIWESFDQGAIDVNKLAFQIRFHDIDEMVDWLMGDIPTPAKERLSPQWQITLRNISERILTLMAPDSAKRFWYSWDSTSALSEVSQKTTLESKILKWFDFIDAYMCTIQEIALSTDDISLLRRRQKAYIERMTNFVKDNPQIFNTSTSNFFKIGVWLEHFTHPEEDFFLYEEWRKVLNKN